jgi:hypothetical protein
MIEKNYSAEIAEHAATLKARTRPAALCSRYQVTWSLTPEEQQLRACMMEMMMQAWKLHVATNRDPEAVYPSAGTDAHGEPFTGDRRYRLHIPAREVRPLRRPVSNPGRGAVGVGSPQ